jgi:hypothetical protein
VEATGIFPLKARPSTKAVRLARSGGTACQLIEELPALQWAAERGEIDIETRWHEARPLEADQRELQRARRLPVLTERSACQSEAAFQADSTAAMVKFAAPEAYNSWSVMRMCIHPLYGIATSSLPTVLVMNNTYYEPRPFFARANVVRSSTLRFEGVVAQRSNVRVCDDSVELVDIPDVVGDISDIRTKLVNQNDPVKLSIWLEVFKRSVLRARPVFPFVVVTETLPTPVVALPEQCYEAAAAFVPRVKAKTGAVDSTVVLAVAKPVLSHAVVVSQGQQGPETGLCSMETMELRGRCRFYELLTVEKFFNHFLNLEIKYDLLQKLRTKKMSDLLGRI